MIKRHMAALVALMMMAALFAGCTAGAPADKPAAASVPDEAAHTAEDAMPADELPAEEVVLTVAGSWPDCRALDIVAAAFTKEYPNCTIHYEYLQDYYASLEKRMSGEESVDIFFTSNIQQENVMLPYALDINSAEGMDMSNTFPGLIDNFSLREEGDGPQKLYAIPLGAELRGMYVNMTLLKSVGLDLPVDQASLLAACEVLKQNGYIPFHGNPGSFAQSLMYPWICNLIANAEDPQTAYAKVDAREPGISEMFREPYAFLYSLVENGYYDYKRAQTELDLFVETADVDYVRYFLNIRKQGEAWEKADDLGQVAFMPSPMSLKSLLDKTKDDYHSEIEYAFMLAPVGPEGGYAYMSPAHGIAVNKNSAHLDWSVRFLNFLFQPENNAAFGEAFNIIPNTKEAFAYIRSLYDVPDDRISQLGQVTFSYGFYDLMFTHLTDVSKANNPKYMQDDGNGNLSLYPLDHFMQALETGFSEQ